MRHSRFKAGDWLVTDEESGFECYASQVKQDWQGQYVRAKYADGQHPSDKIKIPVDQVGVPFSTGKVSTDEICEIATYYVGNTNIPRKRSPADAMFAGGIGSEKIGCFYVR